MTLTYRPVLFHLRLFWGLYLKNCPFPNVSKSVCSSAFWPGRRFTFAKQENLWVWSVKVWRLQIRTVTWKLVYGGLFGQKKLWDTVHVWKMAGLPSNATDRRVLARFDVSMIACFDLAQIWVVRVILDIKNIGIPFTSKKWPVCHKMPPIGAFWRVSTFPWSHALI